MNASDAPAGATATNDSAVDNANRLALAATVLAALAFLVAASQAILEHLSSSDDRGKCTYEAIGTAAKEVGIGWNWKFWKLRVYYPLIDLSFAHVLATASRNFVTTAIESGTGPFSSKEFQKRHPDWAWTPLSETDDVSFNTVADGYQKMVRSQTFEPVTSRDLNWSEYLTLCRWKLQHDCKPITRPRASWAQLLMTFRIRDPTSLVYRKADAGIIPASIDTPMQRIKLFDLGLLALHLGFKKVAIDVRKREFEAVGEFGTITTLLNNELGKVVHFEADILAVSSEISKGSLAIYIGAFNNAQGKFSFGDEFLTNGYNCPLHLVTRATSERWGKPRFELELENWELQALSQEEDSLSKGDVPLEASLFEELHNDWMRQVKADGPDRNNLNLTHRQDRGKGSPKPNQDENNHEFEPKPLPKTTTGLSVERFGALLEAGDDDVSGFLSKTGLLAVSSNWQTATKLRVPTILPATTIASLGACEVGAPARILIQPFLPWIKAISTEVAQTAEAVVTVSRRMTALFRMAELPFVRTESSFWYSFNYVGFASSGHMGWVFWDTHEIYDILEPELQDSIVLRQDGQHTGQVRPVFFTDCMSLLQNFNPRLWADKIERLVSLSSASFRPVNMLWAQILVLDVAIHFTIRGRWHEGGEDYDIWAPPVVAVVTAVANSWDGVSTEVTAQNTSSPPPATSAANGSPPMPVQPAAASEDTEMAKPPGPGSSSSATTSPGPAPHRTAPPPDGLAAARDPAAAAPSFSWDLLTSLQQQPALFPQNEHPQRQEKLEMLATLLQLRSLFYIALLLLMPDSSDVYQAEGSEVEMYMT